MSKDVLIVGAGSAGKRHAGNLRDLGCRISCFDPRQDRVEEAARLAEVDGKFTDFERAVVDRSWDGVVITSPPNFHVDQMGCACTGGLDTSFESRFEVGSAFHSFRR